MSLLGRLARFSRQRRSSRQKIRAGRLIGAVLTRLGANPVIQVDAEDGVFLLDARSRTEAAKLWDGHYDADDVAFLQAATPVDGVFLDIGANVGLILVPLLTHLGSHGRAIGVEPVAINFDRLTAVVDRNRPVATVDLRQVALGSAAGTLQLVKEGRGSSTGNAIPSAASSGQAGTTVPVITLDVLVAELALNRLDAIKIDVEGLEVDVFRGATNTLQRFRPVVYGEFNNQLMPKLGVTFLDAWSLFEPLGYQCFSFRDRMHLVHRPVPSAMLGNVVLATPDRLDDLAHHGLIIDWS